MTIDVAIALFAPSLALAIGAAVLSIVLARP